MKEKKLLVFNLGGALLMPVDEVIRIWCEAIRSIGVRPDLIKIFQHYDDSFQDVIIPELAKNGNWTPLQVDTVFAYAKKMFHDINTSTNLNLSAKLIEIKTNGYALGIITDKNLHTLMKGLNNIGCSSDLFDFVSTSDDGFKKPDSRVFAKMFELYRPEEMLLIGNDHHREYEMSKKVGIEFVAIASPRFSVKFWESMHSNPQNIYDSVPQFIDDFLKK
jgi:HAD superfamily hydrolase (TIGR01549 family)